jgi:hypothetical protein
MIVYLDLNHWIQLAKARTGHPDGRGYTPVLAALRAAVESGAVIAPISSMHYQEIEKIKDPRQRTDIALTITELSREAALVSRSTLLRWQLKVALLTEFKPDEAAPPRPPSIGKGVAYAFDQPPITGQFTGSASPDERTRFFDAHADDLMSRLVEFVGDGWRPKDVAGSAEERVASAFNQAMEYVLLRGPGDDDLAALGDYGYQPEAARQMMSDITGREKDLAERLADKPVSRSRLDDIIAARAVYWDLQEPIQKVVADLKLDMDAVFAGGKERLDRILDATPIIQVESALRRGNFRNGSYTWTVNDLYDLAALGVAVSSCDVVLTDKHAARQICAAGLDKRYRVAVASRIEDLLVGLETVK